MLRIAAGALVAASFGLAFGQGKPGPGIDKAIAEARASFQENRGQWHPQARFLASTPGLDYWVTRSGVVMDFHRTSALRAEDADAPPTGLEREGHVVRMSFVGSSGGREFGEGPRPAKADFFVGGPGRHARGVRSYGEAWVQGVVPGADVRHYLQDGKLRYDVVVNPGTDPSRVAIRFEGTDGVSVSDGAVVLRTTLGDLRHTDLFVYQMAEGQRRQVPAKFVRRGADTVGFAVGQYDRTKPLVIDPLVFGSYVGSPGTPLQNADEVVYGIAGETDGDIYLAGVTSSPTFPVNTGAYDKFNVQGLDAFLMKMDGDGYSVSYSAILGGTAADYGLDIGIDEDQGTVWIGGTTSSTDFAGQVGDPKGSGSRMWVSKFVFGVGSVTPQFVRYVNNPGTVAASSFGSMVVSPTGKVYLAGTSTAAALTGDGFTNYIANTVAGRAGYVMQLDSDGLPTYKTMIGGGVNVDLFDIAVNANDEVVATGRCEFGGVQDTATAAPPVFATTSGVFAGVPGVFEGGRWIQNHGTFVVRLTAGGAGLQSALLGGVDDERGLAVAYDDTDNVYVTGFTTSFNFQRTPGSFGQDFSQRRVFVTKLAPDLSALRYSTSLGTTGIVTPRSIVVDGRGRAFVGGTAGFQNNSPFPGVYIESTPGSIVTVDCPPPQTPNNALDCAYDGGDERVDANNVGEGEQDFPSTTDGFVNGLDPSGATLIYGTYVGLESDDHVMELFADPYGGVWCVGYSQMAWSRGGLTPRSPKIPFGVPMAITGNAFKSTMPAGSPPGVPATVAAFGASNGWVFKLRAGLPLLQSVVLTDTAIAGGLGASTDVIVGLRDPAPAGGVTVQLSLSNPAVASFSATASQANTTVFIDEGLTAATTTIFSRPVATNTACDVKGTLDNDFKVDRLTVSPWLSDIALNPGTVRGGNPVTARVVLFQPAPAGGVTVSLGTTRADVITLPDPAQIVVPEGQTTATASITTRGVDANTNADVLATLLGVQDSATVIVEPARIASFTLNPIRVTRGDTSQATVSFDGRTGNSRTVTISHVAGDTGALVNGQALPVNLTVPPQGSQLTFTVTSPLTVTSGFVTLRAQDSLSQADATLTVDNVDIDSIDVTPGTDVPAGSRLSCQVVLSAPAGPAGLTVNVTNTNAAAGTLSKSQVTVPAGEVRSEVFYFNAKFVGADTTTEIRASRTGFTTRTATITVRRLTLTLTLTPQYVKGGATSVGRVSVNRPVAPEGLRVDLAYADRTAFSSSPSYVVIPGGQTSKTFNLVTRRVPAERRINVTASLGGIVNTMRTLVIQPAFITRVEFAPSTIGAGEYTRGTVYFDSPVAAGMEVELVNSHPNALLCPAVLTVTAGRTDMSFSCYGRNPSSTTEVRVTARNGSSSKVGVVVVSTVALQSISFNPPRVRGGNTTTGTVTISAPAPPGGTVVNLAVADPTLASIVGSSQITIPAGARTKTFQVRANAVSRTFAVGVSATLPNGDQLSGTLYIDP
jgi:hypothetical protein